MFLTHLLLHIIVRKTALLNGFVVLLPCEVNVYTLPWRRKLRINHVNICLPVDFGALSSDYCHCCPPPSSTCAAAPFQFV